MRGAAVLRGVAVLALAGLLGACGAMSPPPTDTFYRLPGTVSSATAAAAAEGRVIYVAPLAADGVLGERALVYVHADGTTLEQHNYHFWVDSPRLMLQQAVATALRAQLGATVVLEPTRAASHTVSGRILRFERVEGEGGGTRVALEFEVRAADQDVPLLRRVFERTVAPRDAGVAAAATAIGTASAEIVGEFATALAQSLGS